MANFTIDELDEAHRNRNRIALERALRNRKWALVPELVYEQEVLPRDFRDHGETTQTATTTVGATVAYARYSIQVTGTGTDGAAVNETYTFDAASTDTATAVADALAALIDADTGVGNPLEFLIASSTNASAVITTTGVAGATFTVTPTIAYNEVRTITAGGGADGAYVVHFATTPPTTVDYTNAGGTTTDIANALEAEMEDKRDGTISTQLDGVVLTESDAAAVVTLVFELGEDVTITTEHPATATLVVADTTPNTSTLTNSNAYVTTLDVNATWPNAAFPAPVERENTTVQVVTAFSGTTTLEVGDAGDPNGLLTSTSIAATGQKQTTGAAERDPRVETSLAPLLTLTSTLAPSAITAGRMVLRIDFSPLVSV